jgi:hypothetical protein
MSCVSAFAPTPWREDNIVTLVPKFKIKDGCKDEYLRTLPKFISKVKANEQDTCIFYGFVGPTEDNHVICREGYVSGERASVCIVFFLLNVSILPAQSLLAYPRKKPRVYLSTLTMLAMS